MCVREPNLFVWEMQPVDVVHSSVMCVCVKRSDESRKVRGKKSNFNFGGVNC